MAYVTYLVSINNPNYNLIDENGNTTTSISTTHYYVPIKYNEDALYSYPYTISRGINVTTTIDLGKISGITYTTQGSMSVHLYNETMSLAASFSTYQYGTDSNANYVGTSYFTSYEPLGTYTPVYTSENYVQYMLSSRETYASTRFSASSTLNHISYKYIFRETKTTNSTDTKSYYTWSRSSYALTYTSVGAAAEVTSGTGINNSSLARSFTSSFTTSNNTGVVSEEDFNKVWNDTYCTSYSSYSVDGSTVTVRNTFTYTASENGAYEVASSASLITPRTFIGVIKTEFNTGWLSSFNSETNSYTGLVADDSGNVSYGTLYGYGSYISRGTTFPGIVTSFEKEFDVSTIDTSWFRTSSTRSSITNSSATNETYAELNNYGVGGTVSSSVYTWSSSLYSGSGYSLSMSYISFRIPTPGQYYNDVGFYESLPIWTSAEGTIFDNNCYFNSKTKASYTYSRSSTPYKNTFSSWGSLIGSTTQEINRTLTSATINTGVNLSATVTNVDFTSVYTSSSNITFISSLTSYYTSLTTASCEVTSYTDEYGYSYYTSFTGELAGINPYIGKMTSFTSWVYQAVEYTRSGSDTGYNNNTLSLYTTTFKTYGDPINRTTISYVSSYEKVYKTTVCYSSSVSTQSVSSTRSSANIPEEFFTTYSSTYRGETQFRTYMGPGITGYDDDEYNFNASVTSIYSYTDYISPITSSTSSSRLNTIDYGGTTYRLSDLISSKSWINVGNTNFTENYLYDYNVSSMFSFDDTYIKSLSTYTTILATAYTRALDTMWNNNSYSATKSTSLVGISTGDRFIDRVEISRTYTSSYSVSNTVVYYNGSTLDTISSSTSLYDTASEQDISTVSRTFISSTGDLTTSSAVISSDTETAGRGSFVYSSRELVASTSEQQNDTLVFASTFNTISFYNSSFTTSTLNTVENTLSATTYEDWYNPVSWTETVLDIATSTGATETVATNSGVVSITQSISFTPTYSDVNGIYVTQ